jgi:hypothetical protein
MVLTLPDGAIARNLRNVRRFKAYAAANLENWYQYINGAHGREAKNSELRLVIGCDKTTSWGMAAVANNIQNKVHQLNYCPIGNDGDTTAPIPQYKWEYTGLAEARVGPSLQDVRDLERNNDSNAAVDGKYWNQCLFIRTMNLALDDDVFTAINQELELALTPESHEYHNQGCPSDPTNNSPIPNVGTQIGNLSQHQGMNSATRTRSMVEVLEPAGDVERARVTTSRSPTAPVSLFVKQIREFLTINLISQISHPADVLNKLLLQKVHFRLSRIIFTVIEMICWHF